MASYCRDQSSAVEFSTVPDSLIAVHRQTRETFSGPSDRLHRMMLLLVYYGTGYFLMFLGSLGTVTLVRRLPESPLSGLSSDIVWSDAPSPRSQAAPHSDFTTKSARKFHNETNLGFSEKYRTVAGLVD